MANILVVDDDEDIIRLIDSLLKTAGYTSLSFARCAKDAFRALGIAAPVERPPDIDLVLMDIMMPETDGIEATRRIKEVERLRVSV